MTHLNTAGKAPVFEPLTDAAFTFLCHKGVACFTRCCAALNLVLTPYDVLRMKHRLGMTSDEFLTRHTETSFDAHTRFPMLRLRMRVEDKKCPFVTPDGCAIYEDRPGACRIYPIGRAAMKVSEEGEAREKFFLVREEHCLGFQEEREWSLRDWMSNQGVDEYNAMNDQWLGIITSPRTLGPQKDIHKKIQMFMMASYNLDRFRRFVFESRFLQLFDLRSERVDTLARKDEELMKLAFDWLKFSLFGMNTMKTKPASAPQATATSL